VLKLFWGAPSISAHFALQSSVLLAFMQAKATSIGAKKKDDHLTTIFYRVFPSFKQTFPELQLTYKFERS
jgi:hypothetical protein